jgi:thiol:disulfide interchange protein
MDFFNPKTLVMLTMLAALAVIPAWRILTRAGIHGAWSLLLLIPFANFLLTWVFAFSKWPNDQDDRIKTSMPAIIVGVVLVVAALVMMLGIGSTEKINHKAQISNPYDDPDYGKELLAK